MSTTLTNGLKLPDKGSVDWYADMQSNYQILDGAVGTVAEHTSALSGKAPLVHTHGKADITDLFNSANMWGAENTYTNILLTLKHTELEIGVLPASNQTKRYRFTDQNNANLGWVQHRVSTSGDSFIELCSINRFSNGQLSPQGSDVANSVTIGLHSDGSRYLNVLGDVYPDLPTRVCNLGTSTNQWNNLYAKNYYYNGTAWGLDQANVWNTYQTIKGYYFGNEQSTNGRTCLYLTSNRDTVGQSGIYITKFRQNRTQGAMNPADLQFISFDVLENSIRTNGVLQLNITNWNEDGDVPSGAVLFSNLSNAHLGSSLIPWKSLNGINPGALSLPGNSSGIYTDNWDKTGATVNSYTPAVDGWLVLRCKDVAGDYLFATWSGGAMRASVRGQGLITLPSAGLCLYIPVRAGTTVDCVVKVTSNFGAYIYPCLGNV